MPVELIEDAKSELSGFNKGVMMGLITDAVIVAANTFEILYDTVANAPLVGVEFQNARATIVLPGLKRGNAAGVLTAAILAPLTTVAQVQQLFVGQDNRLSPGYQASCPQ